MQSKWGKRNGCKFASDAVLNGDWKALIGLMAQNGLSAHCAFPAGTLPIPLKIVTWARRYNSTHPNNQLIRHELKATISAGMPLLHQVVIAEGVLNSKSFRPGLQLLLDRGADIDAQDKEYGYTALHWACKLCRSQLMQYLIEKKANRNVKSFDGETPTELMPKWCKTVIRKATDVVEDEEDDL